MGNEGPCLTGKVVEVSCALTVTAPLLIGLMKRMSKNSRVNSKKKEVLVQLKLEILNKGDEVLSIEDNRIVVKKESGEAEILTIEYDADNFPRVSDKKILVTYMSSKEAKATIVDEDSDFEVGTF